MFSVVLCRLFVQLRAAVSVLDRIAGPLPQIHQVQVGAFGAVMTNAAAVLAPPPGTSTTRPAPSASAAIAMASAAVPLLAK